MGVYTKDQTKMGWLTSILELGAWVGTIYSGFGPYSTANSNTYASGTLLATGPIVPYGTTFTENTCTSSSRQSSTTLVGFTSKDERKYSS